MLLWATTAGLFAVMLAGGAYIWSQGKAPTAAGGPAAAQVDLKTFTPAAALADARQHFIDGRYQKAENAIRLALALESSHPSKPSLEPEARRLNGMVLQTTGHYAQALEEWRWLERHGATHSDLRNLDLSLRALKRMSERSALEQLRGAQKLLTSGGNPREALAEARAALRSLEANGTEKSSLQAAHLTLANIALQQRNEELALQSLRAAARLGPLTGPQKAVLSRLEPRPPDHQPQTVAARPQAPKMQVKVVIPRLAEEVTYPQGAPISHARPNSVADVPETEEEEEEAPAPRLARKPGTAPRFELPKLKMPGQGGQSLPSYQNRSSDLPSYRDRGGSALPSYTDKSTPGGTVPGY